MSNNASADNHLLLDYGIDLKNDRLFLIGSVDPHMYSRLVNGLTILNGTTRKRKASSPPLTIVLSTPGGGIEAAFACYDLIKGNPRPVRIVVSGPCHSSGTLLLAAAKVREALPSASFLYHFGSEDASSGAEHRFNEQRHVQWVEYISESTTVVDYDTIADWHDGETYMSAHGALHHGLIHSIKEAL